MACRRGFTRAHAALAELYHSGRGVAHDPEQALLHALLAGEQGGTIIESYRSKLDAEQISRTCLVRFDNKKYSVSASAVGRPVEIRACADRIELRQDGRVVGEHHRVFGRGQIVYDPWHYVPVLARKPGALRNGAPFKAWLLPAALERVRRKQDATR